MAKRKARIYVENAKQRHVSHWDEDFLTREQLDALHRNGRLQRARYVRRQFMYIGLAFFLLAFGPTLFDMFRRLF